MSNYGYQSINESLVLENNNTSSNKITCMRIIDIVI